MSYIYLSCYKKRGTDSFSNQRICTSFIYMCYRIYLLLSAEVADNLHIIKNRLVHYKCFANNCQDVVAVGRCAGFAKTVCLPSAITPFFAFGMPHRTCRLLFRQRTVCHSFAQATNCDTPPYAHKCGIGFPAPTAESQCRSVYRFACHCFAWHIEQVYTPCKYRQKIMTSKQE